VQQPETHRIESLNVAVHGQGFAQAAVTDDLSAGYPERIAGFFNIGLLHTSLTGREGHASYAPCQLSSLLGKGYDYWALGHVHERELVHERPWVIFSGNVQGRNIRETGIKGCTLVTVVEGAIEKVEHRALDVVRWIQVSLDLSGMKTEEAVFDALRISLEKEIARADGRALIARLVLSGKCQVHQAISHHPAAFLNNLRALASDIGQGRVCLEKVKLHTEASFNLESLTERNDPLGELIRNLRDLKGSNEDWETLLDEFRDLRLKLPAEIREGVEAIRLEDSEFLKGYLGEVEHLLVSRLVGPLTE
jgi:DNA repair protein SbcD/Mre11